MLDPTDLTCKTLFSSNFYKLDVPDFIAKCRFINIE